MKPLITRSHAAISFCAFAIAALLAAGLAMFVLPAERVSPPRSVAVPALLPPFSLSQPNPNGSPIDLTSASSTLGAPVVLPNLQNANEGNAGGAWGQTLKGDGATDTEVDIVFPERKVDVAYKHPVAYADPVANYKGYASESPRGLADVIDLNGTPALLIPQNAAFTKANPGSVRFVLNGVQITVIGWASDASLEAVAESILEQASSTS